jgi:hypothetical protein
LLQIPTLLAPEKLDEWAKGHIGGIILLSGDGRK